jgi:hypothetical protein
MQEKMFSMIDSIWFDHIKPLHFRTTICFGDVEELFSDFLFWPLFVE